MVNSTKHLIIGTLDVVYAMACGYRVGLIAYHMRNIHSKDLTTEHRRVVRIFIIMSLVIGVYGVYNIQKVSSKRASPPPCVLCL